MSGVQVLARKSEVTSSLEMRGKIQISINDWGHLCIRSIGVDSLTKEGWAKAEREGFSAEGISPEDTVQYDQLIILDQAATNQLAAFVEKYIARKKERD